MSSSCCWLCAASGSRGVGILYAICSIQTRISRQESGKFFPKRFLFCGPPLHLGTLRKRGRLARGATSTSTTSTCHITRQHLCYSKMAPYQTMTLNVFTTYYSLDICFSCLAVTGIPESAGSPADWRDDCYHICHRPALPRSCEEPNCTTHVENWKKCPRIIQGAQPQPQQPQHVI